MADLPLHLAAARLRPPAAPADDDDEDWDAVIARAKMQAASPRAPRRPPPPARNEWAEMPETPPPLPRALVAEEVRAKLDRVAWGGLKKPSKPLPAFLARLSGEEDRATPPPLGKARQASRPLPR